MAGFLYRGEPLRAWRACVGLRTRMGRTLAGGHDEAGENHAVILSLVRTCEACDVNPQHYLEALLLRIQDWPSQRLDDLLPHDWKRLMDAGELQPINS